MFKVVFESWYMFISLQRHLYIYIKFNEWLNLVQIHPRPKTSLSPARLHIAPCFKAMWIKGTAGINVYLLFVPLLLWLTDASAGRIRIEYWNLLRFEMWISVVHLDTFSSVWEDHWRRQRNSAVSQLPQQLPWRHVLHVPLWLPGVATRVPLRHKLHRLWSGACRERILCQWLCGGGFWDVECFNLCTFDHFIVFALDSVSE